MRFDIVTLFPDIINSYMRTSILGRALETGQFQVQTWHIREFTTDKHQTVDDTPYGGGAGMVMKVEPIDRALSAAKRDLKAKSSELKARTVVLSARGEQFTQAKAYEYAQLDQLVLICGRYEGIDQRVADHLADEELSIGPYVLAGGEIAALAVAEATARLLPGVLGNADSLQTESHNQPGTIEAPQYTKPEEYNGWAVPEVLLSGDHGAIKKWREEQSKKHS